MPILIVNIPVANTSCKINSKYQLHITSANFIPVAKTDTNRLNICKYQYTSMFKLQTSVQHIPVADTSCILQLQKISGEIPVAKPSNVVGLLTDLPSENSQMYLH